MAEREDRPGNANNMTYNETIRLIGEFLEVAFHQILYLREVYPSDLFEKRKKFNVPVFASRHPILTSYIADIVSHSMEDISKGLVTKLILAIHDSTTVTPKPLEHFVFDLQYLVDPLTTFETDADRDIRPITAYGTRADAELHVRAFLTKLNACKIQLSDLPKSELSWTTFLELNDPSKEPLMDSSKKNDLPPQWIPTGDPTAERTQANIGNRQADFAYPSADLSGTASKRLVPLKSQGLGMIQLQMFVIEHVHPTAQARNKLSRNVDSVSKGKGKEIQI